MGKWRRNGLFLLFLAFPLVPASSCSAGFVIWLRFFVARSKWKLEMDNLYE